MSLFLFLPLALMAAIIERPRKVKTYRKHAAHVFT